MPGEPENQFSLTRVALSTRGAQNQIPINSTHVLTVNGTNMVSLAATEGPSYFRLSQ